MGAALSQAPWSIVGGMLLARFAFLFGHRPSSFAAVLLSVILSVPSAAQNWWLGARRTVRPADYGAFERLGPHLLSPDGNFCVWSIERVDGGSELRLARVGENGLVGERRVFAQGASPVFSEDGDWLAFRVRPTEAEREAATKAKRPPRAAVGLFDLSSGKLTEREGVERFTFAPGGRYVLLEQATKDRGERARGRTLLLRDLGTGLDTVFADVGEHAWHEEQPLLALAWDTVDDLGNGIAVYDPTRQRLRTLDSSETTYRALTWRREAADLAVLRLLSADGKAENGDPDRAADDGDGAAEAESAPPAGDDDEDTARHAVLAWRGLDGDAPQRFEVHPDDVEGFPAGHRIAQYEGVRWSKAGDALFVGTQPLPTDYQLAKAEAGSLRDTLEESAGVEVWHARDIDIQPRQKVTHSADRRRSALLACWLEEGRSVPLGDEIGEQVTLMRGERHAILRDNTPYEEQKRFGPTLYDAYLIDTASGERRRILEAVKFVFPSDPTGGFFAYRRDGALWVYDIAADTHRDLTSGLDGDFVNDERGLLTDENRGFGVAGWSPDGKRVVVHSRYDVWSVATDGSGGRRLTEGAGSATRFRVVTLDPEQRRLGIVDESEPLWLSVYGERTKQSGFARLSESGGVEELVLRDAALSRLVRAEEAPVYAFSAQKFDDPPDVFVAGASFQDVHQVSATNANAAGFAWGRAELVDYESTHGERLQGALYYPADYDPDRRYPLITYIYELRSQQLHSWTAPSERSAYNPTVFSQRGYFVFQPDIVYRPQNPGLSALECVVPAVEVVAARDDVDESKIGLVGHSWGAYQTAFLTTHSDVFAAGVAGAPLTNMISMSMSVYWNTGQTDAWIFHESQGRMDRPFWRDLDTYVRNSPIFGLDRMTTPLLVAFGDEDGAVDWQQGVEFYNAARLAQKPVVMLVYPGENHSLRKKSNQVDYHHRVLEWFAHYLKGAPAATWIVEGQSHADRQRELEAREKAAANKKPKRSRS